MISIQVLGDEKDLAEVDRMETSLRGDVESLTRVHTQRYAKFKEKNGGTGVEAYVRADGKLEPMDFETNLRLAKDHAPILYRLMSSAVTAHRWHSEQTKAETALGQGIDFYEYHSKRFLRGVELEAWVRKRRHGKDVVVAMIMDILANARRNGSGPITQQLLLYQSLLRHSHGQSQSSMARDGVNGIGTSYGTCHRLWTTVATRYGSGVADVVKAALKASTDNGRHSAAQVRELDNYVKTALVARHLKSDGNVTSVQTESGLLGNLRRNLLLPPAGRPEGVILNPPYDDARLDPFFADLQKNGLYRAAGGSRTKWKLNEPECFGKHRLCDVPYEPHRQRLRDFTVLPQMEANSAKREDFVMKFIEHDQKLTDGAMFSKDTTVIVVADPEFSKHGVALHEIRKPPLEVERKSGAQRKKKKSFSLLRVCPNPIDSSIVGLRVARVFNVTKAQSDGFGEKTPAAKKIVVYGIIEKVYDRTSDGRDAAIKELVNQYRIHQNFLRDVSGEDDSDEEEDDIDSDEDDSDLAGREIDAAQRKDTLGTGRWVKVAWEDEATTPRGEAMNYLGPWEYNILSNDKVGYWRLSREADSD